jgi:hypothetical protein
MISIFVKDDGNFWLMLVNTAICMLLVLFLSVQTSLSLFFLSLFFVPLLYFAALTHYHWHTSNSLLYFSLNHENNNIILYQGGASVAYMIGKKSKANSFGVWLELIRSEPQQQSCDVQRYFFTKWQMNSRAFRAFHRHIVWYLDAKGV